jgi:hypothetical protein
MLTLALFGGVLTPDVLQQITLVEAADQYPIYAMLVAAGQVSPTTNPKPQWGETNLGARRNQINNGGTAYTGSTTDLVVDNGTVFRVGDLIVSEATGEVMLIVSIATNTLTVRRGVGGIAGSAPSVANDVWLQTISNASGEGAPLGVSTETVIGMLDNVTQIFRERATVTGTLARTSTSTEAERPRQRRDGFERMLQHIERAIVHGQKSEDKTDAASRLVRTMGGLRAAITTNVTASIGNMTEDAFVAATAGAFQYGSRSKVAFGGATAINALNKIYRGRSRTSAPDAPVGMQVQRILHPEGDLTLVPHRAFTGGFAGDMLILDMGQLLLRPLAGGQPGGGDFPQDGRLQLRENVQPKGDDAVSDEYFAEHTLTWGNQRTHAQLKGITGGVVSDP